MMENEYKQHETYEYLHHLVLNKSKSIFPPHFFEEKKQPNSFYYSLFILFIHLFIVVGKAKPKLDIYFNLSERAL